MRVTDIEVVTARRAWSEAGQARVEPECPVLVPAWEGASGHRSRPPSHPSDGVSLQVYAENVLYEHKMPSEPFWEAHDALELRLASPPAPDVTATLAVTVSFEAACPRHPSRLWKNKGE